MKEREVGRGWTLGVRSAVTTLAHAGATTAERRAASVVAGTLAGLLAFGCTGSTPETGAVSVQLVGQGASGSDYRLRDAQAYVVAADGTSTLLFDTEDDPDRMRITQELDVGDYTLELRDGWRLERLDEDGPVDVDSELVSPNPIAFTITASETTSLLLEFQVEGEDDPIGMGTGELDVSIGIREPDAGPAPETALSDLAVSEGALAPAFDPAITDYVVALPLSAQTLRITPEAPAGVTITVDGSTVASGDTSAPIDLLLGDTDILVEVSRGGNRTTYTVIARRGFALAQTAYVKPGAIDAEDQFGLGLAMDGDTLVVSTPFEDSSASGVNGNPLDNVFSSSGAAYVFVREPEGWVQEAFIKADVARGSTYFGASVAIDGDTLVVGAPKDDRSQRNAGAVYVFRRAEGAWSQVARLEAPTPQTDAELGGVVDIHGDTIVASALYYDSPLATNAGAVYVFREDDGEWGFEASLVDNQASISEYFGAGVAIYGDTLVVGAQGEDSASSEVNGNQTDNSASGSGAAWVYERSGTSWTRTSYLKAFNSGEGDGFGISVDFDGTTILVGARGEDGGATGVHRIEDAPNDDLVSNSGAVYAFVRSGESWRPTAYVKATVTDVNDGFGASLAIDGGAFVVGSRAEDGGQSGLDADPEDDTLDSAGAAYRFVRAAGEWIQERYIKASNPDAGDHFGEAVAVSGGRVAVSAIGERSAATTVNGNQLENSALNAGAVYVFE